MAASADVGWTRTTLTTSAWNNNDTNNNQSLADVPTDCIVLGLNTTIPWDNPHNLISQHTENLIERMRSGVFFPVMFLVGVPGNVFNMAVFRKQGLKDRINMCLFALALADLLNITVWFGIYSERIYSQFTGDDDRMPPSYRYLINTNVLGLIGFMYGPPFLNTVISVERCVCVLFPLHARRCMPTKTLAVIIIVAVSFLVFFEFAVTAKYQVKCLHVMMTGETSWKIIEKSQEQLVVNKALMKYINGIMYGFIISLGCPIVVFFSTTITAIKLRQVVRWRRQASSSDASSSSSSSAAVSSKEVGLTKMLLCLSLEFFVLSIPMLVMKFWPMFNAEMRNGGLLHNTSYTIIKLNQICVFTSSSVNFFVYYCTGTKFRRTLHAMLKRDSFADKKNMALTSSSSITAWVPSSDKCR